MDAEKDALNANAQEVAKEDALNADVAVAVVVKTDKTVVKLAESGSKHVAIMAPGFVADCLETLDELDIELHEEFIEHGGETFTYIPCLNDSVDGMRVIEEVAIENLRGWVDIASSAAKRPSKKPRRKAK